MIASATVTWDPDNWDGVIWDETDDGEVDWDDLEEEGAKYDESKHLLAACFIIHWVKEERPNPNPQPNDPQVIAQHKAVTEDFSQQEVSDILAQFTQRNGEALIT